MKRSVLSSALVLLILALCAPAQGRAQGSLSDQASQSTAGDQTQHAVTIVSPEGARATSPRTTPSASPTSTQPVHAGTSQNSNRVLPKIFAGWTASSITPSTNSSDADSVNAGLLREYGFTDVETATYKRDDRTITVRAARFSDASGAYGAFAFYKTPEMLNEKFGDQGAAMNERILFYKGNVLVEAKLDRVTPMSAAELRELANDIPLPTGPARNLPTLPQYLPKQSYVKNSAKYVVGPIGYDSLAPFVPAELIDFSRGTEVAEAKYDSGDGIATMLLVGYPTPAIAGDRQRAIVALNKPGAPVIYAKRSGPMLVLIAGQIGEAEAKTLLASVNYDADVTWNENTYFSTRNNVANLLVNIIALIGVILLLALIVGLAFGGLRILLSRLFPGRVFDRPDRVEIIRLNLGK